MSTCTHVRVGNTVAIIRSQKPIAVCCQCGTFATRECDWKTWRGDTCDRNLCDECTFSPAKDEDLCRMHAKLWQANPSMRQIELPL